MTSISQKRQKSSHAFLLLSLNIENHSEDQIAFLIYLDSTKNFVIKRRRIYERVVFLIQEDLYVICFKYIFSLKVIYSVEEQGFS